MLAVTLTRIVYLAAFCPYELAADEAQYWDWSRPQHLSLSYLTKGPGIAWLIAASTRLLGNAEWAIRLPAALSTGVSMLALAALGQRIGGRSVARFDSLQPIATQGPRVPALFLGTNFGGIELPVPRPSP